MTSSVWTLTSPDYIRVERYSVEFECRVRNITFVEKYMSVSASGGTGQVATSVSCFGGLGQLYRVKVWAVNGPSISRALVCTPDGKCSEDEGGRCTMTCCAWIQKLLHCSVVLLFSNRNMSFYTQTVRQCVR